MTQAAQTTRTALIVVDMQNAFTNPSAGLAVHGAERVVHAVNGWVASAVEGGWPVYYTRDIGPTELPPEDSNQQTQLHPSLDIRGTVVDKGPGKAAGFSGFVLASTSHSDGGGPGGGGISELAGLLSAADVHHVVIVGLAADVCVAATARDARRLGYEVTIPWRATAFVHAHPDGDAAAVADLTAAGVTLQDVPAHF